MPAKTVVKKPAVKTTVKKSESFMSTLGKDLEGFADTPLAVVTPGLSKKVGITEPQQTPLAKGIASTAGSLASNIPVVGGAVSGAIKTGEGLVSDTEKAGEAVSSIASVAGKLTEPSTWIRVGKVLAGGILIIIGLWMFAKAVAPNTTSAVSSGASKASNAVAPERYMAGQAIRRRAAQTAPRTAAKIGAHKARRNQARTAIRRRERARRS